MYFFFTKSQCYLLSLFFHDRKHTCFYECNVPYHLFLLKQMQACPNCKKPLPRCSLCLVHMGTPSGWGSSTSKNLAVEEGADGQSNVPNNDGATSKRKLSNFTSWFTWCQTCRHGGHAHHLMEWFKYVLFSSFSWIEMCQVIEMCNYWQIFTGYYLVR